MSISIVRAEDDGFAITFEICPNASDANNCECKRYLVRSPITTSNGNTVEHYTNAGEIEIPHRVFAFVTEAPEGFKGTKANWQNHCATEALRIVKDEQDRAAPESLDKLVGKKS